MAFPIIRKHELETDIGQPRQSQYF